MKCKKLFVGALVMTLVLSSCGVKKKVFMGLTEAATNYAASAMGTLIDDEEEPKRQEPKAEVKAEPKPVKKVETPAPKDDGIDKLAQSANALTGAKVSTVTDKDGQKAVKVTLDSSVLFKVGKNDLQPDAKNTLNQFANVVKDYGDCRIAIHGFASSDGSAESNLALSQRRANTVRDYLVDTKGIKSSQIKETIGFGEDPKYLIYDANGNEDKIASRRVELLLYPGK